MPKTAARVRLRLPPRTRCWPKRSWGMSWATRPWRRRACSATWTWPAARWAPWSSSARKRTDQDASELALLEHESERLVDAERRCEALHAEAAAAGEAADADCADAEWAGAQLEACR